MQIRQVFEKLADNWPVKLVCLVLAVCLYGFHQITSLDSKIMALPIVIEEEGAMRLVGYRPARVQVAVRGKMEDIAMLADQDIRAYLDLGPYTEPGEIDVPVRIELSPTAQAIDILEIQVSPDHVTLNVDKKEFRSVPVAVSLIGNPPPGFEVSEIKVMPSEVRISGPASIIEAIDSVITEDIVVDDRYEGFSSDARVLSENEYIRVESGNMVSVHVGIDKVIAERSVFIPISYTGLADGLQITASKQTLAVVIRGSQPDVNLFAPSVAMAAVDCRRISAPGTYELPLRLSLPANIEGVSPELPISVAVTVAAKPVPPVSADSPATDEASQVLNSSENGKTAPDAEAPAVPPAEGALPAAENGTGGDDVVPATAEDGVSESSAG